MLERRTAGLLPPTDVAMRMREEGWWECVHCRAVCAAPLSAFCSACKRAKPKGELVRFAEHHCHPERKDGAIAGSVDSPIARSVPVRCSVVVLVLRRESVR